MKPNLTKSSSLAGLLRAIAQKKRAEFAKNPPQIKKSKASAKPSSTPKFKPATFWQLPFDNVLNVTIAPWPAKSGPAKLRVEITPFEGPEAFAGSVEFRLSKTPTNSGKWTALKKAGEDDNCNVYYEAPIKLVRGAVFLQFRLYGQAEAEAGRGFTELKEWQIKIN